jgi:hypothetical protein
MNRFSAILPLFVLTASLFSAEQAGFSPPQDVGSKADLGRGIQRTMRLLASSTPEHRNTVGVLFYGQSITEQKWSQEVANYLKTQFPNANLIIENRAIGGFASQLLVKTAETDLYPFYPDLLIFHVYGSHIEYENIIKRVRQRTTAEILVQTDHVTKDENLREETDAGKLTPKNWDPWMNYSFLPGIAEKYQCELVDQRNLWKKYLQQTGLSASNLLSDGVHLNDHGSYLMAELVKAHLRFREDVTAAPADSWVSTMNLSDFRTDQGTLKLDIVGNRVDLVLGTEMKEPIEVIIDGRKPSEFPELYGFSRTTAYPGSKWPCLLRVESEKPLQLEEWTATIKDATTDLKSFKFAVSGSKTGPDGEGSSERKFVSRSGRVMIDPADWNFVYALKIFKKPLPENFKVQWKVIPHFMDSVEPESVDSRIEAVRTVALGLPNKRHTVELRGVAPGAIEKLRVYRPRNS